MTLAQYQSLIENRDEALIEQRRARATDFFQRLITASVQRFECSRRLDRGFTAAWFFTTLGSVAVDVVLIDQFLQRVRFGPPRHHARA